MYVQGKPILGVTLSVFHKKSQLGLLRGYDSLCAGHGLVYAVTKVVLKYQVSLWLIEQVSFGKITTMEMEAFPFSQIVALQEVFRNIILICSSLNVIYSSPVIILVLAFILNVSLGRDASVRTNLICLGIKDVRFSRYD